MGYEENKFTAGSSVNAGVGFASAAAALATMGGGFSPGSLSATPAIASRAAIARLSGTRAPDTQRLIVTLVTPSRSPNAAWVRPSAQCP